MALELSLAQEPQPTDILHIPQDQTVRAAIRQRARAASAHLSCVNPPARTELEQLGQAVLAELSLPSHFLGFAMVAVNNAFWLEAFAAVPTSRRLLLLPKCLSDSTACAGQFDSVGLQCKGCGACDIFDLKHRAESLGYQVIIAEGTSSVLMKVLEGEADAILGVACLDSLARSFTRIAEIGIPQVAVPLLTDGCIDTTVEHDEILSLLTTQRTAKLQETRSYVPLLRESTRIFAQDTLAELLAPYSGPSVSEHPEPLEVTDRIALDWLHCGGKRLRPFVTLAAYAVARYGTAVLKGHAEITELLPPAIKRLAVAIEAVHKASLTHDDIEDNDAFRYGQPTLHRTHGIAQAINIGDYLVGLGYRLVAGESGALGAACVSDLLRQLSQAHVELCRGQGAELRWQQLPTRTPRPLDVLAIYALKTAPAFEVALYAGLRAAEFPLDQRQLKQFSTYLGEGFQVFNDLDDWQSNLQNKVTTGQDALAMRPTMLRAFALEGGGGAALRAALNTDQPLDHTQVVAQINAIYQDTGAFLKAERLLDKLRARAQDLAQQAESPVLRELLGFLTHIVLPASPPAQGQHA